MSTQWQIVHDAESPEVVLATDFPVSGRNEGGFTELAPRLDLDCQLWQTVPPVVAPGTDLDPADYLRPWLTEIRESGYRVRSVLGYCAGSVFAGALAQEIARWQDGAPSIVVFDPELVDVPTVHLQFGRVIGNMTTVLEADELTYTEQEAQRLAKADGVTPAEFAANLFEMFRPLGEKALARTGMEPEFAEELISLVGSFMAYLSVASNIDPRPGWARATAISSTSPGSGLNRLRSSGQGGEPGFVAEELRFDVEHRDLLRTDDAAKAVAEILTK
ncbi:hypothetical protein [Amycolatopsis magusensis]|uniref:hypothetical protein n=1 Tax=Amycolatopsis magusensis TaxID=882444 RepID=UPI003C2CB1E0